MYYDCHFQGRAATRTLLTGGDASIFALEVHFGGHRVGAHRAVGHSLCTILLKGLHSFLLLT
jgi:hypothetical protein